MPTAMHSFDVGHDTPASVLCSAFGGRGVLSIDHRDPFHRSASGTVTFPASELPTAVQARWEEHDTAARMLNDEPAGFGVCSMRQCVPSHRSASVLVFTVVAADRWAFAANGRPGPPAGPTMSGPELPTAVQAVPDVHDTPWKILSGTAGLGGNWMTHCGPVTTEARDAVDAAADPAPTRAAAARQVSLRFMVRLR